MRYCISDSATEDEFYFLFVCTYYRNLRNVNFVIFGQLGVYGSKAFNRRLVTVTEVKLDEGF